MEGPIREDSDAAPAMVPTNTVRVSIMGQILNFVPERSPGFWKEGPARGKHALTFMDHTQERLVQTKIRRITRPRFAIHQKLAASGIICV